MFPTLNEGQEVLVNMSAYRSKVPKIGDVVLVWHPYQTDLKILKRVTAVTPQNNYFLEGDNPDLSTDSRQFGEVTLDKIVGQVTSHFA